MEKSTVRNATVYIRRRKKLNNTYSIVVIVFFLIIVLIGIIASIKTKNDKDWLVAGQSLGIIPSIGTYFATIVSSVTVMSFAGYCYLNGWGGMWVFSGSFLTSILAVFFYAKKIRKTGKVSLPDYLEMRFGKIESVMASFLILLASVFMLCAQVTTGAIVLRLVTGWSTFVCIVLLCIVIVLLTSFGGMFSVAWTDTFCALVLFFGVWIMALGLLDKVGGFSDMQHTLHEIDKTYLNPMSIGIPMALSWIFVWGVGNYGVPHYVTRFFTAKDEETAKKSQAWCLVLFCLFYTPVLLIGLTGIIVAPGIQSQDEVTVTLIQMFFNPFAGGFIFAAILAGCVSTADSILLMASTTVSNDIYKKLIKREASSKEIFYVARVSTWIIGGLTILATLVETEAVLWIQARVVTIMGAAMAPSVMVGIAWKRANTVGGISSFVVGLGVAVIWYLLDQPYGLMPMLPAFAAGMVSMMIGTLIGEKYGKL